ncbi:MAG: hypothetical protein RL514_4015 [Verrucomicrobiota bacterium]|jgi:hypothetical protein
MPNLNWTLPAVVKNPQNSIRHFTGALPNPPEASGEVTGESRNIRQPSGEVTGASRNIRQPSGEVTGAPRNVQQPSGEVTGACRNIRKPNPELGTVPRSVKNCVRQLGCEPPDTLWHNAELGTASRDIRKPNTEEGIAVLRIFIHLSHLGIAIRRPTQANRHPPTAPLHHPDTYPPGRLSVQRVPEATWQDRWQPASSPLPAGEGQGEGERPVSLSGFLTAQTSLPFSLTPALSRWEREPRRPPLPLGDALRTTQFAFRDLPFAFPALLSP